MDKIIAEGATVTTGSICHHFKNKDEIKLAIMNHSLHFTKDLVEEIQSVTNLSGEPIIERINKGVVDRLQKKDRQILYILFIYQVYRYT